MHDVVIVGDSESSESDDDVAADGKQIKTVKDMHKMRFNKIMLAGVMAVGSISMANAADQGTGKVTFTGSIINAPCSIDAGSVDQTVNLGEIASGTLANGNSSPAKDFNIELVGCDVPTAGTVTATFSGTESVEQKGLLAVQGSAKGAAISINDSDGNNLPLGTASKARVVDDGQVIMQFSANLKGDGIGAQITPGEFTSVANFTLAYM